MLDFVGFVVFCALLAGVVWVLLVQTREERLRDAKRRAEAEIDFEYRKTRRRMNDIAGQSWRNIGE